MLYILMVVYFADSGGELLERISLPLFLVMYTSVLALLMLAGVWYRPKETYDLGWHMGPYMIDNPFSLRDDIDRSHAWLGFLLVIPNFIRLNLVFLRDYLSGGTKARNMTTASALILLARSEESKKEMKTHMSRFGKGEVEKTLNHLVRLGWIKLLPGASGWKLYLTGKGRAAMEGDGPG